MDAVEEFLARYEKDSTRDTYRSLLKSYLEFLGVKGDYFKKNRDYKSDVTSFAKSLSHKPPKTVHATLSVVRMFLDFGEQFLPKSFWQSLPGWSAKNRSLSQTKIPSNEEISQILVFGEPKARALFLLLLSSGLRLEEALRIRVEDIDLHSIPCRAVVFLDKQYVGSKRSVFFSSEAAKAITVWLKQRDSYLLSSIGKDNFRQKKKNSNDERLFPFSYNVARCMWTRILKKSGFDQKDNTTGRLLFGVGCLRRFFETRASLSLPNEVVDAFLGRSDAVEHIYKKYGQKSIQEMYLSASKELSIFEVFSDSSQVKKLEAELKLRDARLKQLEEQVKSHEEFFQGIDSLARERLGEQFAEMVLGDEDSDYVDEYAKYRKREDKE